MTGVVRKRRIIPRCPDCGKKLLSELIMTRYSIPLNVWVCVESDSFGSYRKEFEKEWFKKRKE